MTTSPIRAGAPGGKPASDIVKGRASEGTRAPYSSGARGYRRGPGRRELGSDGAPLPSPTSSATRRVRRITRSITTRNSRGRRIPGRCGRLLTAGLVAALSTARRARPPALHDAWIAGLRANRDIQPLRGDDPRFAVGTAHHRTEVYGGRTTTCGPGAVYGVTTKGDAR